MSMIEIETPAAPARTEPESSKRRDIIDGARKVFFEKGFDAASMDEVAKAASVSKATIYVYFNSRKSCSKRWCTMTAPAPPSTCSWSTLRSTMWRGLLRRIAFLHDHDGAAGPYPAGAHGDRGGGAVSARPAAPSSRPAPAHGGQRLADLLRQQAELGRLAIDRRSRRRLCVLQPVPEQSGEGPAVRHRAAPTPSQIEATVDRASRDLPRLLRHGSRSRCPRAIG